MTPEAIAQAADILAKARKSVTTIGGLDAGLQPSSWDEAYAIQDALIAGWDDTLLGWKVGATNAPSQENFGIDECFIGPMFASDLYSSPAELPKDKFQHTILEQEFVFRLSKDLPASGAPYTREAVVDALGDLMPAFEVLSPRLEALAPGVGFTLTADFGGNGGLVLGEAVSDWKSVDLASQAVSFVIDGKVHAEGTGSAVLGDPLNSVEFCVNRMAKRGIDLKAGQLISAGAMTGVNKVPAGKLIEADFGSLGAISAIYV